MDLLSRPRALLASLVLAVAAVGVVVQRLIADLLTVLLILIILILVAALVYMWLRQKREKQQGSADIESTIVKQADREIERSVAIQAADIADMKADLLSAIQALKSAKGGEAALATLPWYLVMGPSRSGKGTLVRQSGLHFPLKDESGRGPRAIKGVGGTRAMEWWVTEEALLLEMPGGLLSSVAFEDDDWVEFLKVLKKARGEKSINGVIVPVVVDQVADQSDADLDKLARRIRERISQLNHHLGIQFPTYLVFTGCDRLAGFSEFFADLDADKRSHPWGATVPTKDARKLPAEDLFDAEFRQLEAALARRALDRVPRLTDDEPRARVFAFSQQLGRVRPYLRRVVKTIFDSAGAGQRPLFRGFYLTSAAPAGNSVDRVYRPAASRLGLSAAEQPSPPAAAGPWFVHELFTKVIFPDKDLVTETDEVIRKRQEARRRLTLVLGSLLAAFTISCSWVSCVNNTPVQRARKLAQELRTISATADFARKVRVLDDLRSSIARLERLEGRVGWWRHLGGYWGGQAIQPALDVYAQQTLAALASPALPRMGDNLDAATSTSREPFVKMYYRYWAWRLLQRPGELTPGDAPVVARGVREALEGVEIAGVDVGQRGKIAAMVERDVRFLAEHEGLVGRFKGFYSTAEPGNRLESSTEWLRMHWKSEEFYRLMIRDSRPWTRPVDLGSLLKGQTGRLRSSALVAGPFTRDGWREVIERRVDWYRSRMAEPWVVEAFGDSARGLAGALEQRYADEYTRLWEGFLSSVTASRAKTWPEYVGAITDLSGGDSPLFALLRHAGRQTDFSSVRSPAVAGITRNFDLLQSFERAPSYDRPKSRGFFPAIARFFGGLFRRKPQSGTSSSELSDKKRYLDLLNETKSGVDDCQQQGGGMDACLKFFNPQAGQAGEFDRFLRFADDLLKDHEGVGMDATLDVLWLPLEVLPFLSPPEHPRRSRIVVGRGDHPPGPCMPAGVDAQWQQHVVAPYVSLGLAGKYPLAMKGPDASPADFAAFFKPDGTFWRFYNAVLINYLAEDGTPLPTAVNMVTPELSAAVRKAREIRDALFAVGSDQPAFRFRVRPDPPVAAQGPAPTFYWTELAIGAQEPLQWNMGSRPWSDMAWPGPTPNQGASIRANGAGTVAREGADGIWGLFRLLDRPQTQFRQQEGNAQVSFGLAAGPATWIVPYEFQAIDGGPNHPFRKGFLRFKLPSTLCRGAR